MPTVCAAEWTSVRERLFSTSPFQPGGTVWSCPQLTVVYTCILCSAACANRRKVVCIWTPDFLSTIALIPREKQRRNIAIVAKKQSNFPNGIYFVYMLRSTNVWKHTLEQRIKFYRQKPPNQYSKIGPSMPFFTHQLHSLGIYF